MALVVGRDPKYIAVKLRLLAPQDKDWLLKIAHPVPVHVLKDMYGVKRIQLITCVSLQTYANKRKTIMLKRIHIAVQMEEHLVLILAFKGSSGEKLFPGIMSA